MDKALGGDELTMIDGSAVVSHDSPPFFGDLLVHKAELGHTVRVNVPHGQDWYGYFTRRLAETPENVTFFLHSLVGRH